MKRLNSLHDTCWIGRASSYCVCYWEGNNRSGGMPYWFGHKIWSVRSWFNYIGL